MDVDIIAKQILSRTGYEKFNAAGKYIFNHIFLMLEPCPACSLEHKQEIRGYIDRDHQEWGYYIKCPITGCKIYMRRK